VAAELDALGETFARERTTFVTGYGQAVEDWIALHPQWDAAIRKAIDPASLVESRLGFGYQLYRIAPAEVAGNLDEQVQGLGDTLFGEVSRIARELDRSFTARTACPSGPCHLPAHPRETRLSRLRGLPGATGAGQPDGLARACTHRGRSPAPSSTRASG